MNPCELNIAISALANAISCKLATNELNLFGRNSFTAWRCAKYDCNAKNTQADKQSFQNGKKLKKTKNNNCKSGLWEQTVFYTE